MGFIVTSVTVMLVTVMQIYEYNYHLCNKYQRIYLLFFCLKILSRSFVGKTSWNWVFGYVACLLYFCYTRFG
jgi:hypothetical protein